MLQLSVRAGLASLAPPLLAVLVMAACGNVNPPVSGVNASAASAADKLPLQKLTLPPGFKVAVYARVPNARSMVLSPAGTLFVGTRSDNGPVYAVVDKNQDGIADDVITVAAGLHEPNGVEFRDGALYVAEVSRILRFDNIEKDLRHPPKPVVVTDNYPKDEHHGWKYIRFGPDGWLYVPIGAPCNVCESKDPRKAGMTRIKPDGSGQEIFAKGIRNTVGFDWDANGALWFTDNGRDWLGDDSPPDELNCAPKAGMHFGFPYCHGKGVSDPEFGKNRPCSEFTASAFELGPHVAALGMRFYKGAMFPQDLAGHILIAQHGSWNRAQKIGYRVVDIVMAKGQPVQMKPFISGWLEQNGNVWGRPVDILVMPDGSVLVSDDFSGTIYRVTYQKPGA